MNAYVDSSALLAVLLGERGGAAVKRAFARIESAFASPLLEAEVRSALAREGLAAAVAAPAITPIAWVYPDRPLTAELEAALEAGHLRGADLWHVACALWLADGRQAELLFVTLDEPQRRVAARLGFKTVLGVAQGG